MNKNEYEVFKGLLGGEQAHTLSNSVLMSCVLEKTMSDLGSSKRVFVLHDFCDIRKPESKDLEYLGKVRSLEKTIVNGYQSFNSVVVDGENQTVHLLNNEVFSNAMPNYVCQDVVNRVNANPDRAVVLFDKNNVEIPLEVRELVENKTYVNAIFIAQKELKASSLALSKGHSDRKICHVLDREFDNEAVFDTISELADEFVIRLKNNRLSNVQREVKTKNGTLSKQVRFEKLADLQFKNKGEYSVCSLTLKHKTYKNVVVLVEYDKLKLAKNEYNVVRISLSSQGKAIFDQPMLLISNQKISQLSDARQIYQAYLLRFKIELVFRFLKQYLGWETVQVRNFNAIVNLLAIAFFLVGYFKELEDDLKEHPIAEFICKLAKSKGIISIHFLLKGLEMLISYQLVVLWMEENNINKQEVNELINELKLIT
jgi:hypothetical protein